MFSTLRGEVSRP